MAGIWVFFWVLDDLFIYDCYWLRGNCITQISPNIMKVAQDSRRCILIHGAFKKGIVDACTFTDAQRLRLIWNYRNSCSIVHNEQSKVRLQSARLHMYPCRSQQSHRKRKFSLVRMVIRGFALCVACNHIAQYRILFGRFWNMSRIESKEKPLTRWFLAC